MNAFTPYLKIDWQSTFAQYPSWPLRMEAFADSQLERPCLESIRDDAARVGNLMWRDIAQSCLDNGDLTEMWELIADEAEAERTEERAYRYEVRTGKCFDDREFAL